MNRSVEVMQRCMLVFALCLFFASNSSAEGEWAATNIADAGTDIAWTGEFRGAIATDREGTSRLLGLQVYALGDGEFGAALLEGGLPGNGWNRSGRTVLSGAISEDQLTLVNEQTPDLRIRVNATSADVVDAAGNLRGVFAKVERSSPYEGLQPPANAYVLFDGENTAAFKNAKVVDGLLQVGTDLIPTFHNFQLHVEFILPYMPKSRSQNRGNSGVYLQSRYEVQVLDSFGLEGIKNECGALYRQRAPDLNMAFPPLRWQTYDITFHAPRFDSRGNKCANARLSVLHNGVKIHDNLSIQAKTGAGQPEGPIALPIRLQDHSNPVQYRNIWLLEIQ